MTQTPDATPQSADDINAMLNASKGKRVTVSPVLSRQKTNAVV